MNGTVITGNERVNYASSYFSTVAVSLTNGLQNNGLCVFHTIPNLNSCILLPTSIPEVISVIKSLKNSGSGLYDLSVKTLKINDHIFSVHITFLYNYSLEKVTYPQALKIARVVPGHKSGQKDIIDNYRPISNLPVISKIFEKLTLKRFASFVDRYFLLSDSQFGFRKGRNITQAAIKLTSHITNAYHNRMFAACFFLDLRKAFDTIDHEILLEKLFHIGFRGPSHDYVSSNISDRKQYVQVGQFRSNEQLINKGVPQGSVLGPLLFCLYINDIVGAVDADVVLFADDAAFFVSANTLLLLYSKLHKLLSDLAKYLKVNKLVPNISKSKLMFFASRKCDELIAMNFDGEIVEWVDEYKYLGLHINNKMCFASHIEKISSRVSRFSGVFYSLYKILPRRLLILLYFTFILPHLTLHIEIWGAAPDCHLRKLAVRQNQILRTILGIRYIDFIPTVRTEEMYRNLKVLTIKNLFKLQLFRFMVLLLNDELPMFYNMILRPLLLPYGYNTRGRKFRHPLLSCEVERRAIAHQIILLYEETPSAYYEDVSICKAKQLYKDFLLSLQ